MAVAMRLLRSKPKEGGGGSDDLRNIITATAVIRNYSARGAVLSMSKKLIVILSAAGLVMVLFMGGVFFMMWSKISQMEGKIKVETEPAATEAVADETVIKPVFPLKSFIVNLAGDNGTRYLKIKMDLEITDESFNNDIRMRIPQIRDSIMMTLTSKRYVDIKDTAGKIALREDIQNRVNAFFKEPCVSNVYFTDFVIQ
jgi:flagellar FliL protein